MTKALILLLLLAAPAGAQTKLVFAWNPNPSNVGWPPCGDVSAKKCRTGYTLTDVTKASAPMVISTTIERNASTYILTPLPKPGLHIYSLTVDARNSAGTTVHSAAATLRVVVPRHRDKKE